MSDKATNDRQAVYGEKAGDFRGDSTRCASGNELQRAREVLALHK